MQVASTVALQLITTAVRQHLCLSPYYQVCIVCVQLVCVCVCVFVCVCVVWVHVCACVCTCVCACVCACVCVMFKCLLPLITTCHISLPLFLLLPHLFLPYLTLTPLNPSPPPTHTQLHQSSQSFQYSPLSSLASLSLWCAGHCRCQAAASVGLSVVCPSPRSIHPQLLCPMAASPSQMPR